MYLEWVTSAQTARLDLWDEFILNSPRGHYSQLSTWLRSFRAYGFDFAVLTARQRETDPIIGGIGLLHIGNRAFRIMTSPIGPIIDIGFEYAAEAILDASLLHAENSSVTLFQLQFPCSTEVAIPALIPGIKLPGKSLPRLGRVFPAASPPNQMLWIQFPRDLKGASWQERMLLRFSQNTRRCIRRAERSRLQVFEASTEIELREAYSLIEQNGREQGYATRAWTNFGPTLIEQVYKRQAIVLVARHQDRNLGVHYGSLAGKRYSYLMGGTVKGDLPVGHFLHWTAINKAKELGMLGYDLTSNGSSGVLQFKMGFRPTRIQFIPPRYYVFSPLRFEAFSKILPILQKHKRPVANVLRAATRFFSYR